MNNLVSICVPAYNDSAYIKDTINSFLNQTYQNIEVIVVDDVSQDDTYEVLKEIKDSRLKVYKNEVNLGMGANWNKCISHANGEFIKLLGADDMLMPNAIELEVSAFLTNPSVILVESDTLLMDSTGKKIGVQKRYHNSGLNNGKSLAKKYLIGNNRFGAAGANMFRKSSFEKYGEFDTNFLNMIDFEFFLRLACHGDIYIIREVLNGFRLANDSNQTQVLGKDKEKTKDYYNTHKRILNKYKDVLNISNLECMISLVHRNVWSFAAAMYLKIVLK